MNIFNSDGWFSRFFGTLGDIIIVNILFILCSIPIVTMGASMSAMYFTLLKKQRTGENGGVVKLFFKGFKDNFKQSTISWSLFLLISFIFTLDFNLFWQGWSTGEQAHVLHQCRAYDIDMLHRNLPVPCHKCI